MIRAEMKVHENNTHHTTTMTQLTEMMAETQTIMGAETEGAWLRMRPHRVRIR